MMSCLYLVQRKAASYEPLEYLKQKTKENKNKKANKVHENNRKRTLFNFYFIVVYVANPS